MNPTVRLRFENENVQPAKRTTAPKLAFCEDVVKHLVEKPEENRSPKNQPYREERNSDGATQPGKAISDLRPKIREDGDHYISLIFAEGSSL